MHVSDSAAAVPQSTTVKDEPRASAEEPPGSRSGTGRRFRNTLERKRRQPAGDGAPDGGSAAAMAGWFRPEPAAPTQKTAVGAVSAPRAADRVLIGSGPDGAQARIRIGAGGLAGTEIQLSAGAAGHAVEARLLTHTASSRQTL